MFRWCMRGRRQRSAQRKPCTCIQVGTIDDVNTDTDDPAFPAPGDLSAIPAQVFTTAWYGSVPGLLPQQRAPVVPSSQPSFLQAFSQLLEAGSKDSASALRLRQASTLLSLVLSQPLTAVLSQKATLKFLQLMVSQ
jgi:hypothetical protein